VNAYLDDIALLDHEQAATTRAFEQARDRLRAIECNPLATTPQQAVRFALQEAQETLAWLAERCGVRMEVRK